jgi:hypothetical protein
MMFSCRLGTPDMIWLDLFLPKLGRNLLVRDGPVSCSGFLRNCAGVAADAFRFFFEVTLIMSKLSGSIIGWTGPEAGSK